LLYNQIRAYLAGISVLHAAAVVVLEARIADRDFLDVSAVGDRGDGGDLKVFEILVEK
jgi:hypothetical protein